MKLDTIEQRYKAVDSLISKAFEIDELFVHDKEKLEDWIAATEIRNYLIPIREMIRTEKLFLDAQDEINFIPVRNIDMKNLFLNIVNAKRIRFINDILLCMIAFALDYITIWHCETAIGKKFYKDTEKKLNALLEKYRELCDL